MKSCYNICVNQKKKAVQINEQDWCSLLPSRWLRTKNAINNTHLNMNIIAAFKDKLEPIITNIRCPFKNQGRRAMPSLQKKAKSLLK